ncbi:hypothetical protein FLK61_34870 [Paenalkalicoccus suaedae]|uniref:Pilus assembly protein PilO n=1 Tax=Paenalkalicoccus suaedae TaxID=2592382 RepID=A0A859FES8_9BACI|nr:hypothetical protein [Paenalkalicoccus suaedae]QKS71853.1 hypothetical protein FLK61_34870 [Paenalkalicoccus suaedae]
MTRKHYSILAGLAVVIIIALIAVFFVQIQPAREASATLTTQVDQERELIAQLEDQVEEQTLEAATRDDRSTELQRRLPVVKQTDQFILDINRAEEVSGVRVQDMLMAYDLPVYAYETIGPALRTDIEDPASTAVDVRVDDEENEENEESVNNTSESANETADENNELTDTEEQPVVDDEAIIERQLEAGEELPRGAVQQGPIDGVLKQTATITLHVNNYESLSTFLQQLENSVRILNTESIVFLGEEEDRIFDGETNIFYEVQVSSFYYPELEEELESEAPIIDYREQEEREQPFLN